MGDREAESTDGCSCKQKRKADCVQFVSSFDPNWLKTKFIGGTRKASSKDRHAEFVTETTSDKS